MRRILSLTLIIGSFALVACGNARVVNRSQTGGILALQGNRSKAMEDAHVKMKQHCQGPYTIVEEGEQVIGTDTVAGSETYETQDGVATEGGSSTRQATEWRVKYVCGQGNTVPAGPAPAPAPAPAPPAGGPPGGEY